ncbi:armadillo-type protein [Dissophora ornata]|nr:armadillo-type protein [Dissophora ornata]
MAKKRKYKRPPAAPQPQSFRVVSSSGSPMTSPTIEIRSVLDTERGRSYILWEDIRQQLGNIQYVMRDGVMIPFMRDANSEDILPLRIEAHQGVTLEAVFQESEQDVDDYASMPDLEFLSIADPDPKHGLEKIHPNSGSSNALNGPMSMRDVNEAKAMLYLTQLMMRYNQRTAEEADILKGEPLRNMSTLAFSDTVEMQLPVAGSYLMISIRVKKPISKDALKPLVHLLQSHDLEVQRATTAAISKFCTNNVENRPKFAELGAIEPLIRLIQSPDIAVQCEAAGCICSLSQIVAYTPEMVRLGALAPLVRLVQSRETLVQTNATGVLNNISDCEELVGDVVKSGAVPFLIRLLGPGTPQNIQLQCAEALCNISYNEIEKERLLKTDTKLVTFLVKLIDSTYPLLQQAVTRLLSSLSTIMKFHGQLIKEGGIPPLIRLLESETLSVVLSPICCLYNIVAMNQKNIAPFAQPRIIKRLVDLQTRFKDEQIQDRALGMLQVLTNYTENHKMIVDAGVAERFYSSVLTVSKENQALMVTLIDRLDSALDTKSKAIRLKLVDALIGLTKSSTEELQTRALKAMAGMASILPNHPNFQKAWHGPDHNLQELLCRMLESTDAEILSHGLVAFVKLLEKGDGEMINLVLFSDALEPGRNRVSSIAMGMIPPPEGSEDELMVLPLAIRGLRVMILFHQVLGRVVQSRD